MDDSKIKLENLIKLCHYMGQMNNLHKNPPIISVAPMMDWTDRHDRYFLRLISPHIHLYTEMITAHALIHGNAMKLLEFHPDEKYVALQLGGSDPKMLGKCAKMGEEAGYNEVNLNVGCPSPRVSSGRFGACLMFEPQLVADCVNEMRAKITIPVTVKCRTGVDYHDSYEALHRFITLIHSAGCETIILHARKAWLSGLSPKENREIPPLQYETVYQIKKDFPHLNIIINGGIKTLEQIKTHLTFVDGVMIGRAAYSDPYFLAEIETHYYSSSEVLTRSQVAQHFLPYIKEQLNKGTKLTNITRHILGLFQGQRGASAWRRHISENAHAKGAGIEIIEQALTLIGHNA